MVKQKLKSDGFYRSSVDEIPGKATTDSIIEYQKSKDLQQTGVWDAALINTSGLKKNGQPMTKLFGLLAALSASLKRSQRKHKTDLKLFLNLWYSHTVKKDDSLRYQDRWYVFIGGLNDLTS